jgi:hypothetical protein
METLKNYLKTDTKYWDGHIHLFDHSGTIYDYIDLPAHISKFVGFMDIDFKNIHKYSHDMVMHYYDDFIKNHYNSANTILLATANDCNTMIELYNKYPTIIKGFGELKCYSYYNDDDKQIELPYGNLDWIRPLCEFNKALKLPIYIHWYVYDDNRRDELDKLLSDYSSIPFVLCHCGLSPFKNFDKQFEYVTSLILKHSNLYVDISYSAAKYFNTRLNHISTLKGKCFLGTDLNINCCKSKKQNPCIQMFNNLSCLKLDYNATLKKLFKI